MLPEKPLSYDRRHTASRRPLLLPLAALTRVLAALLVLAVRVLGVLLTPLLPLLRRALASLNPSRPAEGDESYASADEDHFPRPWPATEPTRGSHSPIQVHHYHHIHHPYLRRQQARSLPATDQSQGRVPAILGAAGASEHALDTDSDSDQGAVGSEGPLHGLALELHRKAMQAQAELDARLPRAGARAGGPGLLIDATDSIKEEDQERRTNSSRDSPVLAAITSNDPSTPLQSKPITVHLRPGSRNRPPPPTAFPRSFSPLGPPPSDRFTSTTGKRRASAPDPILLSPLRAAEMGPRQTSESSFRMFRRASGSSQGSSAGRRIRLMEPDWQPYIESHARARTRVQLNALLSSARDMHSQQSLPQTQTQTRERTRHLSLKSSLEESLAPGLTAGSRWDLRWHALSAHTIHAGAHAQVHARSHRTALPLLNINGSPSLGSDGSPSPYGRSPLQSAGGSDGTASPVPEEPDLWFERFFPGRAAAGSEWDWRRPTPQRIMHERRAAQEAARRAGAACRPAAAKWSRLDRERERERESQREELSPTPPATWGSEMDDEESVLDQVAQLLFEAADAAPTPGHARKPLSSRIASHANAAAASVASSSAQLRSSSSRRTKAKSLPLTRRSTAIFTPSLPVAADVAPADVAAAAAAAAAAASTSPLPSQLQPHSSSGTDAPDTSRASSYSSLSRKAADKEKEQLVICT